MINKELYSKAKELGTPEELLKLAHENGMEEFGEENAKAYFDLLHKSGELSDSEIETAAGGGCAVKVNGRAMVALINECRFWRCDSCNSEKSRVPKRNGREPRAYYLSPDQLGPCYGGKHKHLCSDCYYCSYEKGAWWCNCYESNNE